jgi:predicted CoA-substrate-specific enzyme activase
MIGVGIDAGSRAIKIALVNTKTSEIITTGVAEQGVKNNDLAMELFQHLLTDAGLSRNDVTRIVATGYGRNAIEIADTTITEITCHAKGVHHIIPDARTIIEIGGQDSKLLRLTEKGTVHDFAMNDRCAAGTGRFLEVVATRLGIELGDLGKMSEKSKNPAAISSTCIVFAETEIIGLLAAGTTPEDIVAGVQNSIATRISAMVGRSVVPPVVFTGGVALIPGMNKALERIIGQPVIIAPYPQMTGALGAAILAARESHQPEEPKP